MTFCECENSKVNIIHLPWDYRAVVKSDLPVTTACTNDLR